MKKAPLPVDSIVVDKDMSPVIPSFIEYDVDPDLCESIHIIQKHFTLLNKKLTLGIGNMTRVVQDNGDMRALVISILMSFKNESATRYQKLIDNLNEQIKGRGCVIEINKTLDTYLYIKKEKYFDGLNPKQVVHQTNAQLANMEIGTALMDLW